MRRFQTLSLTRRETPLLATPQSVWRADPDAGLAPNRSLFGAGSSKALPFFASDTAEIPYLGNESRPGRPAASQIRLRSQDYRARYETASFCCLAGEKPLVWSQACRVRVAYVSASARMTLTMTDAKLTIAIMTSADRWEWTLYERDVGVIASGVSNRHEEAMAEGWSAARRLTPASSNIYPDITLVMPDRRPLTQLSGMTDRGSDLQRTGHHDHLNSRP